MDDPIIDVVRRIYVPDEGGVHLEVAPDETGLAITISTPDEKSEEWFGKVLLTLDKKYAQALGTVLIAASKD